VIPAVLTAVLFGLNGTEGGVAAAQEPPAPVSVTGEKLPDPGDLYEQQRLKHEKLEAQTREIEREELSTNRTVWRNRQISSYSFKVSQRGAWSGMRPIAVTVRDGQVVSSEYVGDSDPGSLAAAAANAEAYSTIPKLFDFIESLLDNEMTLPRVFYDKEYGFPAHISNNRFAISDDEWSMQVWDFEVLQ
jgi:hypothetical protein